MTRADQPANQPMGVFFSIQDARGEFRERITDRSFLRRFDRLVSGTQDPSEALQALLQLGADQFGVEHGHLTEIDPAAGTHTISAVSGPHPRVAERQTRDLSVTYCRKVIARNAAMALTRAPDQGWNGDPALEEFGFSTYLGAKIVKDGMLYGTLCFVDRDAREASIRPEDAALLGLFVEGVERVLRRREEETVEGPSGKQLDAVFHEAPTMMCLHDVEGKILAPNRRFCAQTGYSGDELRGMTVTAIIGDASREHGTPWWGRMQPGDNEAWQGTVYCRDGSELPVQIDVHCFEAEDSKQFVLTGRDVTEQMEIENDVRQRERLHHETLKNITDTVLITRDDGSFTYVCPNVHHIFGYDQEEAERMGSVSALLGEDPAFGVDLEREGVLRNVETSVTDAEGERHDLLVNVRSVSIQDGTRLYACRDVTERKAAEREQRQTKRLLQKIFQSLTEVVLIVDPEDRTILSCNSAVESVFGYDRSELVGKRTEVLHADEASFQEFGDVSEAVLAEEGYFEGEYHMRRKDGDIIQTEHRVTPLIGDEWPRGVVSVVRDVTERKEAERELRLQEERLRDLANRIPGVVIQFFARDDGTYGNYFISEQAETVLGIDADPDTFFERYVDRVPDSHQDDLVASIDEAVENEAAWYFEMPFVKPSGERIWVLGTTTPRRRNGELVYNGVLLDITEQKQAQRALREERDRFATLFHNLPTPVVHGRPDEEGRLCVAAVNDPFESVFGYEEDEILGEDIQGLIVPEEGRSDADSIRRQVLTGRPINREVRRETVDGIRDFRVQVALREGEAGPVDGFAIYTDITERKQRERTLARRKALLEAQAESTIDGLLVSDPDGTVAFFNDRFLDLWKLSETDVDSGNTRLLDQGGLVESMSALLRDSGTFRDTVSELLSDPGGEQRDLIQLTDGRWIDRFSAPIGSEDRDYFGRLWVFRDVTEERRMQERLLEVQEEERRRIDQEIHDNLGGLLTSLQLTVDAARRNTSNGPETREHLDQIEALVSELSTLTRTISRKLFPSALDDYGLSGTLPALVEEIRTDFDLDVTVDMSLTSEDRFSTVVERTAYWIVQEALLNVAQHAEVDEARIEVERTERGLTLKITDQGVGFDPSPDRPDEGIGLESIRRRVVQLNGDIAIRTAPTSGTRISATLPLPFHGEE